MTIKRRNFIKNSLIAASLAGGGLTRGGLKELLVRQHFESRELNRGRFIILNRPEGSDIRKPLDEVFVKITGTNGSRINVWDGRGNKILSVPFEESFHFRVGGAMGYHKVTLHDENGEVTDWAVFRTECQTGINDEGNEFRKLFELLYETLTSSTYSHGRTVRYNGKYYRYYSSWFQDHVFVAEAMKYFAEDLKTGVDLYADGQREDGMIWDNYKHPYPDLESFWEYRFRYGKFTYRPEDPRSSCIFVRIPVENIGEHTFLEGLYYAWKATGDDAWMEGKLDNALKAVHFATSSPYYWSGEKQLLKRPFTIDRWDFQSVYDAEITGRRGGNDAMGVDLDKTRFGIMFGDNICLAHGCMLLAEMLEHAGRTEEAGKIRKTGNGLWERIRELSWNGRFFRHWVPLEPSREPDFGVDTSEQVTLSNAMAMIRGLDHDRCVSIIRTYQRIREEMPGSSPGEWYMCYPPFPRGFRSPWEYMNGGVSPILAGDLALGAFEHGFEQYGIDILRRLYHLGKRSGYVLEGCYKGKMPEEPDRNFTILDLKEFTNAGFVAGNGEQVPSFGSEIADFRNLPLGRQEFEGIPFEIIHPDANNRKACLVISRNEKFSHTVQIPVNRKVRSLYLLHTAEAHDVAGTLYIHYDDGSWTSRHILENRELAHYWYPELTEPRKGIPNAKIAWKGPGKVVGEVGIYAFGMNNPHPDKKISHFKLVNDQSPGWAVFGITLSDGPHYFKPTIISTIPRHWASAHVFKALMEGLAGIRNAGIAFDRALLAPRWEPAGISKVSATAVYVPSGGYLSYTYRKLSEKHLEIHFTGTAKETEVNLLIPGKDEPDMVKANGKQVKFSINRIENSRYAVFQVQGIGVHQITLKLI